MLQLETELVTVTTAGTPVHCSLASACTAFRAKNPHTQTGWAYIGVLGMVKASGVNVIDDIAVDRSFEIGVQAGEESIDPSKFYFDADTDGQIILVTAFRNV